MGALDGVFERVLPVYIVNTSKTKIRHCENSPEPFTCDLLEVVWGFEPPGARGTALGIEMMVVRERELHAVMRSLSWFNWTQYDRLLAFWDCLSGLWLPLGCRGL